MGEKKTVGERKPFSRLLVASAWHLISRWELLTFRWPTRHLGMVQGGGEEGIWYLRFRLSSRRGGMKRAQWIAWITSEYLIIQLTCWQTGAAGLQQSRRSFFTVAGMDLSVFAGINWPGGRGLVTLCYCSISRPTGKLCPDSMKYASHDRASFERLFRWKESVGVDNSIDAFARFRVEACNVQSVVVNIETGKRIRRILGEIEASYSCIVFWYIETKR